MCNPARFSPKHTHPPPLVILGRLTPRPSARRAGVDPWFLRGLCHRLHTHIQLPSVRPSTAPGSLLSKNTNQPPLAKLSGQLPLLQPGKPGLLPDSFAASVGATTSATHHKPSGLLHRRLASLPNLRIRLRFSSWDLSPLDLPLGEPGEIPGSFAAPVVGFSANRRSIHTMVRARRALVTTACT